MRDAVPSPQRLWLDPIACDGVGICTHLAGDLVRPDSWGYPIIDDVPLEARTARQARAAVRACPHKALHIDQR